MQSARVYRQLDMYIELVLVFCHPMHGMRHQSCYTHASPALAHDMSYPVSNWSCDRGQLCFLQTDDCHLACIHRRCHVQGLLHFLPRYTVNIVADQHESTRKRLPAAPAHPTLLDLLCAPQ